MNIELQLKQDILQALSATFSIQPESEIVLQPTRKEFQGTYTLVTFPYTKVSKLGPEQTGEAIGQHLKAHSPLVADFNVVKGFLNLVIAPEAWLSVFTQIHQSPSFGFAPSNGKKVMVEYSSPNANKPLHLGHLRNNFLGYSVSKILSAAGYDVRKVNLVNDRGIHICKSMLAYQLFGNGETPESAGLKGDHLVGKYYVLFDKEYKKQIEELQNQGLSEDDAKKKAPVIIQAQEMLLKWEQNDPETIALWKKMNGWVLDGFKASYETMGVSFDQYYFESNTYLLGKELVEEGLQKGVFFQKEDSSVWIDLADEGMDQKLVLRSDGTSVYITQDMGTADMKYQDFPFNNSVYVVGNEQDYHFKVLFAILKKLGRPYADGLFHLSYGMVDLPSGKMKSREGTVVDADDLMQEMFQTAEETTRELGKIDDFESGEAKKLYQMLGHGALKYFLLKVDPKKRMLFNPQESIEFQGNTGPFIQYTHARIAAILRKAKEINVDVWSGQTINLHPIEQEVIYLLSQFPDKVQEAATHYAPSVIANYVYDLAKEYNRFYAEVSIFNESDRELLKFRIAFCGEVAQVIKNGMGLLGIEVPEKM